MKLGAKWPVLGAITGVVATLPLIALTTLVFRFPVPFVGYVSGPAGVGPAVVGGIFYGAFFGGFAVQALLGAAAGRAGAARARPDAKRMRWLCLAWAVVAAECGVLCLSILDWIIGPW